MDEVTYPLIMGLLGRAYELLVYQLIMGLHLVGLLSCSHINEGKAFVLESY